MSFYAAVSEADGIVGPSIVWTDDHSYIDTNYSEHGALVYNQGFVGVPVPGLIGADSTDGWWLHYRLFSSDDFHIATPLIVLDSTGHRVVTITGTTGYPSLCLYDYQASTYGLTTFSDNGPYQAATTTTIDLHGYKSGSDAKVDLYLDGGASPYCTVTRTGTTSNGIGGVLLSGGGGYQSSSHFCVISEVIIADEDTRGLRAKTLLPAADGYHTDFNGGHADIAAKAQNGMGISTGTTGSLYTFTPTDFGFSSATIKAVVLNLLASTSDSKDLQAVVRRSSTDYLDSTAGCERGVLPKRVVMEVDPVTSSAWAISGLSSEFGVKSV